MSAVPQSLSSTFNAVNKPVFVLAGGFIAVFCGLALISLETLNAWVDAGFGWSVRFFGLYWQILLFATFVIGMVIAIMPAGRVRLGNIEKPEFTLFQWGSMIMCTLLAGGGVFWAAGEPMAHFLNPAPYFGVEGETVAAADPALAQAFLHWGFLVSVLFLILTTVFVATTGDSMTYVLSVAMSNNDHPATAVRVFWGVAMGLMALILISIGSGGISKLQSFIVVTAVPVSLVLLPSLWDAFRIVRKLDAEQQA